MNEIELLELIANRLFWVQIGMTGGLMWLVLIFLKIRSIK